MRPQTCRPPNSLTIPQAIVGYLPSHHAAFDGRRVSTVPLRALILVVAAIAAAAAAGYWLPDVVPPLATIPPAVLGGLAALAAVFVAEAVFRSARDARVDAELARLSALGRALELELAAASAASAAAPPLAAPMPTGPISPTPAAPPPVVPPPVAPGPGAPPTEPAPAREPHFANPKPLVPLVEPTKPLAAPPSNQPRKFRDATAKFTKPPTNAELLSQVQEAIRADRIDMHLQPIVDAGDRKAQFYECFTRLRTDRGAELLPEQFLPIVEREGLTAGIDNMLLLRCVQVLRRAHRRDRPVTFFCNISGQSLADRVFFADFLDFLSDNTLLSENLVFEIAHTDLASLPPEAAEDLHTLAGLGFRFAIDRAHLADVTPALLSEWPIAFVKADMADMAAYAQNDPGLAALQRPLVLARVALIATKVERERHADILAGLPVQYGQGFLYGAPAPLAIALPR